MKPARIVIAVLLGVALVSAVACGPETYRLYTTVDGQGEVSPSSGEFDDGESVSITAIPASGWQFDHWEGAIYGTANPSDLQMHSNNIVEAYFTELPTPTPTPSPSPTPIPTPTAVKTQCETDRDNIQAALDAYKQANGDWPTADGLAGDILWDELVPQYMSDMPLIDSSCDWRVNGNPEGTVCVAHTC